MSVVRPRWLLSVDPHLYVDEKLVGRVERHNSVVELDLSQGSHVLTVAPSGTLPSDYLFNFERRKGRNLFFSPFVSKVLHTASDRATVEYRPNLVLGYMLRGKLRISVE
jgi:hypothetical protein